MSVKPSGTRSQIRTSLCIYKLTSFWKNVGLLICKGSASYHEIVDLEDNPPDDISSEEFLTQTRSFSLRESPHQDASNV